MISGKSEIVRGNSKYFFNARCRQLDLSFRGNRFHSNIKKLAFFRSNEHAGLSIVSIRCPWAREACGMRACRSRRVTLFRPQVSSRMYVQRVNSYRDTLHTFLWSSRVVSISSKCCVIVHRNVSSLTFSTWYCHASVTCYSYYSKSYRLRRWIVRLVIRYIRPCHAHYHWQC